MGKRSKETAFKRTQYTYAFKQAVVKHHAAAPDVGHTITKFFADKDPSQRPAIRKLIHQWSKSATMIGFMAVNVRTASHLRQRAVGVATALSQRQKARSCDG
jgi:hypothetical protein